jgi:hypothetical protein
MDFLDGHSDGNENKEVNLKGIGWISPKMA